MPSDIMSMRILRYVQLDAVRGFTELHFPETQEGSIDLAMAVGYHAQGLLRQVRASLRPPWPGGPGTRLILKMARSTPASPGRAATWRRGQLS